MDFTSITENFTLVVLMGCLAVGYIIKHATFLKIIPNDFIPVILAGVGMVLNVIANGPSLETIVYGAITGLASTGFHQSFKNFIENIKT